MTHIRDSDSAGPSDFASALTERIKELECLYSISKIIERRNATLDQILSDIARSIPQAWQYPDVTCARIVVNGVEYRSVSDRSPVATQECVIIADGAAIGLLEVGYLEERPPQDEGPFLIEERRLINVIGQRIGEIVEKKRAEQRVMEYQQRLRSLASQVTCAEIRERRRIAQELHDRIGQSLATIKITLGVLVGQTRDDDTAGILSDVRQAVGQTIADTRSLIFEISPPVLYEFGLAAALEWLSEQALEKYGLAVVLQTPDTPLNLEEDLREFLFQATSELIANVGRHAETESARISMMKRNEEVIIQVGDDGKGFDVELVRQRMLLDNSFGLFSIGERLEHFGGRMEITSARGRGTLVILAVPIEAARERGRSESRDDPNPDRG